MSCVAWPKWMSWLNLILSFKTFKQGCQDYCYSIDGPGIRRFSKLGHSGSDLKLCQNCSGSRLSKENISASAEMSEDGVS